jgi:hypothetical protein
MDESDWTKEEDIQQVRCHPFESFRGELDEDERGTSVIEEEIERGRELQLQA